MKKLLSISFTIFALGTCMAQDPHFSQFYNSPLTLNPALTGAVNADMRFVVNYRNQWASVTTPYQTFAASGEAALLRDKLGGDYIGVGLQAVNDIAGDAKYRNTNVALSGAYHKSLNADANQFFSAGFQLGMVQRSLDFTKLFFDEQFNGDILDPSLGNGETFSRNQLIKFDLNAGVNWWMVPNERSAYYFGASAFHLTQPNVSFMGSDRAMLYRKFCVYGGAEFALGERFGILPQAVYMNQGPASQINVGALLRIKLGGTEWYNQSSNSILFGGYSRIGDAGIAMFRVDLKPISIGLSYDFNYSGLSAASKGFGGPELSLTYRVGAIDMNGGMKCPTF